MISVQQRVCSKLNMFYLESRYPGDRNKLAKEVGPKQAKELLAKAKGVLECLRQMLQ